MENIMMGTRGALALLAFIVLFILISLVGGEDFFRSISDVIMTMFE